MAFKQSAVITSVDIASGRVSLSRPPFSSIRSMWWKFHLATFTSFR